MQIFYYILRTKHKPILISFAVELHHASPYPLVRQNIVHLLRSGVDLRVASGNSVHAQSHPAGRAFSHLYSSLCSRLADPVDLRKSPKLPKFVLGDKIDLREVAVNILAAQTAKED